MLSKAKIGSVVEFYLPVLLWCMVIYYFSSIPSLKSDMPSNLDFILRKIAHITEYGILTFLLFRAISRNTDSKKAITYSILFSIAYAFTDEYHQLFVFGRNGDLVDVFIDSMGIFLMIFLIYKDKAR